MFFFCSPTSEDIYVNKDDFSTLQKSTIIEFVSFRFHIVIVGLDCHGYSVTALNKSLWIH